MLYKTLVSNDGFVRGKVIEWRQCKDVFNFQFDDNRTIESGHLTFDTGTDQNYSDIVPAKCGTSDKSNKHGDDINIEVMSEKFVPAKSVIK